ncbi:MAG: hypothetical protein CMK59_09220 [Proteobacteria bacterium]|nr:hypothetical protein [Pseudomonadota bacterium]
MILFYFACIPEQSPKDTASNTHRFNAPPLRVLSSGECPELTTTGETVSFVSSDEERRVTVIIPEETPEPSALVFFFHGLLDASYDNPTALMSRSLDLQELADERNAVILLPESKTWDLMGQEFYLWQLEEGTIAQDLTLYDDLRTCAAEDLSVDLDRVSSIGFSGGALFNTVLISERGADLAAAVELSGGSDYEIPTFEEDMAPYSTPNYRMPVLLVDGGDDDLWPNASFPIVNFQEGTERLEGQLLGDGHHVGRCSHTQGHSITSNTFDLAIEWLSNHTYEVPSPMTDISNWDCWLP